MASPKSTKQTTICNRNGCKGPKYETTNFCYRHRRMATQEIHNAKRENVAKQNKSSICAINKCCLPIYMNSIYCCKHKKYEFVEMCSALNADGEPCGDKLHGQFNVCTNHIDMIDYTDEMIDNIEKCKHCGNYRYMLSDKGCTYCAPCHGYTYDSDAPNNKGICKISRTYGCDMYCYKHNYMNNYTKHQIENMTAKCPNKACQLKLWKYHGGDYCEGCRKSSGITKPSVCNGTKNNGSTCTTQITNDKLFCKLHDNMNSYTPYMLDNITKCTKGHYRYCEINKKNGNRYKKCIHCKGNSIDGLIKELSQTLTGENKQKHDTPLSDYIDSLNGTKNTKTTKAKNTKTTEAKNTRNTKTTKAKNTRNTKNTKTTKSKNTRNTKTTNDNNQSNVKTDDESQNRSNRKRKRKKVKIRKYITDDDTQNI